MGPSDKLHSFTKFISLFGLIAFIFLSAAVLISVDATAVEPYPVPYQSYTYDYWGRPVLSPIAYLPARIISGQTLGVGPLRDPSDLYIDDSGVYIADTGNNRVLCLDSEWNLRQIISGYVAEGELRTFKTPRGVCVDRDGNLYVADTGNARIVVLDAGGHCVREIRSPEPGPNGVIPEGFRFRPLRLGVDFAGRIYVICDEVYDGILEFGSDGVFRGFIGAPRVALNPLDYLWSRIATRAQRDRMSLFLPTEYSSIEVDDRGLLLATVSGGAIRAEEAVRRLNTAGQDVLRRNGFESPIGDYGIGVEEPSSFVDVTAREGGIYSVLDRQRGRVFTYDGDGNLLYVFGGLGYQEGTFIEPVAIASTGMEIAVLDRREGKVTVFEPTQYAMLIHQALRLYSAGEYELSAQAWRMVLALNANCDLAYNGIARAFMREHNYREAMRYFRLGTGLAGYSEALGYYRRELVEKHFSKFMATVLLAVVSFLLVRRGSRSLIASLRRSTLTAGGNVYSSLPGMSCQGQEVSDCSRSTHEAGMLRASRIRYWLGRISRELSYALHVAFHPFDGFWCLKYEGTGSILSALILLLLVAFTYVLREQYTGFLFNPKVSQRNIVIELASILVPFLLWCIVNWSLTTLVEGKGRFRDIVVATAYALTPLIIVTLPNTFISNFITIEEGTFYYLFLAVAVLWTGVLIFIGTMVTHEFSFAKTALTSVLTVAGICVVVFIGLVLVAVTEQVTAFVVNVFMEVTLRS